MPKTVTLDELKAMVGEEVGVSDWIMVDQERINAFADATIDHQFIHVDEEKAKLTPFGGTIAHGFLTLSLMVPMGADILPHLSGAMMGVNYGTDKLRFLAPVPSGSNVRGRATVMSVDEKPGNRVLVKYNFTVEIEGSEQPALVCEWLSMIFCQ